jgi:hypothetical protein
MARKSLTPLAALIISVAVIGLSSVVFYLLGKPLPSGPGAVFIGAYLVLVVAFAYLRHGGRGR